MPSSRCSRSSAPSGSTSTDAHGRDPSNGVSSPGVNTDPDTTAIVIALYGVSIVLAVAMLIDIARRPASDFEISALVMNEQGRTFWRHGASRGTWLVFATLSILLGVLCCVVPLATSAVYFFTLRPQLNQARQRSPR